MAETPFCGNIGDIVHSPSWPTPQAANPISVMLTATTVSPMSCKSPVPRGSFHAFVPLNLKPNCRQRKIEVFIGAAV